MYMSNVYYILIIKGGQLVNTLANLNVQFAKSGKKKDNSCYF